MVHIAHHSLPNFVHKNTTFIPSNQDSHIVHIAVDFHKEIMTELGELGILGATINGSLHRYKKLFE